MITFFRHPRRRYGVLLLALLAVGCASLDQLAPRPGPALLARLDEPAQALRGRDVYVAKCGACHSLQAVGKHADEYWHRALPRMARRAELSTADAAAVAAYVTAMRRELAGK